MYNFIIKCTPYRDLCTGNHEYWPRWGWNTSGERHWQPARNRDGSWRACDVCSIPDSCGGSRVSPWLQYHAWFSQLAGDAVETYCRLKWNVGGMVVTIPWFKWHFLNTYIYDILILTWSFDVLERPLLRTKSFNMYNNNSTLITK